MRNPLTRSLRLALVLATVPTVAHAFDADVLSRLKRLTHLEWNTWRTRNPSVAIDLADAQLPKAALDNRNLTSATLSRANLAEATMAGTELGGAKFDGANLSGAYLGSAKLNGAKLDGANLTGANVTNAILAGASLTKSIAPSSAMMRSNLSYAVLTEATFSMARFDNAVLRGIKGGSSTFDKADFTEAVLHMANLSNSQLSGAKFVRSSLVGTSFANSKLNGAVFEDTGVTQCDFTGADLTGADLLSAQVFPPGVWPARTLTEADFSAMSGKMTGACKPVLQGSYSWEAPLKAYLLREPMTGDKRDALRECIAESDPKPANYNVLYGAKLAGAILTSAKVASKYKQVLATIPVVGYASISWDGVAPVPKVWNPPVLPLPSASQLPPRRFPDAR